MNTTSALPHTPVQAFAAAQAQRREQLLSLFDKSGLSVWAFAKQHQTPYSTLCQWRQRRAQRSKKITFTQLQVDPPADRVHLLIELGPQARVRLHCPAQLEMAARLLRYLQSPGDQSQRSHCEKNATRSLASSRSLRRGNQQGVSVLEANQSRFE